MIHAFWLLRLTYSIGLASLLVAKFLLPDFLQYGKTLKQVKVTKGINRWIHLTVPKSYFYHFYVVSTCLSLGTVCVYPQYVVVWALLCHSSRRLYESLFVSVTSEQSRMNCSHYVVGIWFYTTLYIILNAELYRGNIQRWFSPTALILFCIAGWDQHENHKVLAGLAKYSLPQQRLFRWVCCPHYTDEILLYACLLAASKEFIWPLVWVLATLSVAGVECHHYYKSRFGHQTPAWALVPYVF